MLSKYFRLRLLLCGLLLASVAGCQQRVASTLQGHWVGKPDTAAARAQRDAKKYGDDQSPASPAITTDSPAAHEPPTDWEQYNVEVEMHFRDSERVELSLDRGKQALQGKWKVVSTTPTGCTIEIQTTYANHAEGQEPSDAKSPPMVRRRFELLIDNDEDAGEAVGFLLTEVGADRLQGALYFQRPEK